MRKTLKHLGVSPNVIAEIGEIEGDSLDMVEVVIALEDAFASRLKK